MQAELTWDHMVRVVIRAFHEGQISMDNMEKGVWGMIREARRLELEKAAEIAEDMGSYEIAEAIRKEMPEHD